MFLICNCQTYAHFLFNLLKYIKILCFGSNCYSNKVNDAMYNFETGTQSLR